jgi:hypothetical protein
MRQSLSPDDILPARVKPLPIGSEQTYSGTRNQFRWNKAEPKENPLFSLTEASKSTGKSKSTIHRAIKSGRLSARFEDGEYKIDPAELSRLFDMRPEPVLEPHGRDVAEPMAERHGTREAIEELATLRAENRLLHQMTEDLRAERDRLLKLVEEQTGTVKMLTHQPAPQTAKGRKWPAAMGMAALGAILAAIAFLWHHSPASKLDPATSARPAGEPWQPDSGG